MRDEDRAKPLSYDPEADQFITYDDLVDGKARLIPLDALTPEQVTRLVIERQRVGPDYTMGDLSGRKLNRDEVIEEIEAETAFGKMVLEAEVSYLGDFQQQVAKLLESE
jgi:hypothetical protein